MPLKPSNSNENIAKAKQQMKQRYEDTRRMLVDYQKQIEKWIQHGNSLTSAFYSDLTPQNYAKYQVVDTLEDENDPHYDLSNRSMPFCQF